MMILSIGGCRLANVPKKELSIVDSTARLGETSSFTLKKPAAFQPCARVEHVDDARVVKAEAGYCFEPDGRAIEGTRGSGDRPDAAPCGPRIR